jgi:hypothetical protein
VILRPLSGRTVLRSIARRLFKRLAVSCDERQASGLLNTACEVSDAWNRAVQRVAHTQTNVHAPRLDESDVESVLRISRKAVTDDRLFVLTDRPELRRLSVSPATWIDDLAQLRGIPGQKGVALLIDDDTSIPSLLDELDAIPDCTYFTPKRTLPPARYFQRNRFAKAALIRTEKTAGERSHFHVSHFETLMQAVEATRNIPGDYVEIGVYRGGSAYAALAYMEEASVRRRSWFFDTFDGFAYEGAAVSKDAQWKGTHGNTSLEFVRGALGGFRDCRVERLEIIADDLPSEIRQIACANVDVDIFEASLAAALKVAARMTPGGIMILDDQGHTPHTAGAYRGAQQFLASEQGRSFTPWHLNSGQMLLVRNAFHS